MSELQVVQWRTDDEGMRVALVVARGRRLLQIIPLGRKIKIEKVSLEEAHWIEPLLKHGGQPYAVKSFARRLLRLHKSFGGTPTAKRILKEIIA